MNLLFYPEQLKQNTKIYLSLKDLNINFHNNVNEKYDKIFFWTYKSPFKEQDEFIKKNNCINKGCFDVSKTRVSEIYDNIKVNPEKYNGFVVRKNERQCSKDEVLLECPTKKEDGFIYRKYIESFEKNYHIVYRLFYFDGCKLLTKKYFDKIGGEIIKWEKIPLSTIPINKLNEIEKNSKTFGLNIGEIDLLKDNNGIFYVIDINNVAGYHKSWITDEMKELRNEYNFYLNEFLTKKK